MKASTVDRFVSRVLVLSFTDLASDPRVDRQISALKTRYEIVAAGLAPPRYAVTEFVELPALKRTTFGNVLGVARLLARRYQRVYWTHPAHLAALSRLGNVQADVVIANDLDTLPLALRLGLPVVLDAHEYAPSQFAELRWWRILLAPYLRWSCSRYIPQVASMMTVSEGIASAYEKDTGVRPIVVTNAPPHADLLPTPVHDPIRILHHGTAVRGRGLEEMVRLGKILDAGFTLDFVLVEGTPGYRDKLIRQASPSPHVRFPRPWPMSELVSKANDYDIGLFLLPPINFQRRYALPNKFFEFIQARLAVAIGPSPEMARLVIKYGCGVIAQDFSAEGLAEAFRTIDDSAIESFKRSSHMAADELCAERNSTLIRDSVERALAHEPVTSDTR